MPDIRSIIDAIQFALKLVFGDQLPAWASQAIGYLALVLLSLAVIWVCLFFLSNIIKQWKESIWPLFYNGDEKRRVRRRQRFADHIESEIRRLNNLEVWSDYRFAELEAEVEAEGRRRTWSILPFRERSINALRREKSLSKALALSQERLILLEGDPGSGKSVALRHVAQIMAHRAMREKSTKAVIPIYVNLKELREENQTVNRTLVESFILKSLNRVNDRDIEEFLEDEFGNGLSDGTWLFLFDSFDEIPQILSSTEADAAIKKYAEAISDFLHGMNRCRGIIASREFRGPGMFGWPKFRISPLSEPRRLELIRKTDLNPNLQKEIIGQLGIADQEIHLMASNPFFLGLICEHLRNGNAFPQNTYSIFETYIRGRLDRDNERLQKRFGLSVYELRSTAESIAFAMAADDALGLSPTRTNLKSVLGRLYFESSKLDTCLDALEYIKLARSESTSLATEPKNFTFAHRRFQEYFATNIVLRDPGKVGPRQLLADARWRETAVVLCQTQGIVELTPLLEETRNILREFEESLTNQIVAMADFFGLENTNSAEPIKKERPLPSPFPWPAKAIHVLKLLQEGFSNRLKELPEDISRKTGVIILAAYFSGAHYDKKWALEVAGSVPEATLLGLLRLSYASKSGWIENVAFDQIARLRNIPPDIAQRIRYMLCEFALYPDFHRTRFTIQAYLKRLTQPQGFLSVAQMLLWIPRVDLLLHTLLFFAIVSVVDKSDIFFIPKILGLSFVLAFSMVARYAEVMPIKATGDFHSSLTIIFFYRLMFIFFPALWLFGLSVVNAWLILDGLYVISWTPFALSAAYAGRFIYPAWWLAVPIIVPIYGAARALNLFRIFVRTKWRLFLIGLSVVLLIILSIVGLSYLLVAGNTIAVIILFVMLNDFHFG